MKTEPAKEILKNSIEVAMHTTNNETDFKKQLVDQGVNTIVRRNDQGRIYGMTFIDHESRTVWNGSQLSKNLSANVFNDLWKNEGNQKVQNEIQHNQNNFIHRSVKMNPNQKQKNHMHFLIFLMEIIQPILLLISDL